MYSRGCLRSNENEKMDFSIFHGQNTRLQRNNVNIQSSNAFQDQSYRQESTFQEPQLSTSSGRSHLRNKGQFQQQQNLDTSTSFISSSKVGFQRQEKNRSNYNVENQHSKITGNPSTSTLGLMAMAKPKTYSSRTQNSTPSTISKMEEISQSTSGQSKARKFGETDAEKICIFTGTVERVIKWGKIFQNHFCNFEVIAAVLSIADGNVQFEKIMLLRDKKGPILQVTYYSNATHINIEDFHLGQILRAVGRIIGPNIMSANTIRAATMEEIETLPRMCYVSDNAVSSLCGSNLMLS